VDVESGELGETAEGGVAGWYASIGSPGNDQVIVPECLTRAEAETYRSPVS